MAINIKSAGFKAMYESEREHWRGKFRDLFDPEEDKFVSSNLAAYFEKGQGRDALEHNSVYVIYEFMTWQDDRSDPLHSINYIWDFTRISPNYRGPKEYLKRFHERRQQK
ncbi:hypothetical protein D9M68_599800 [compost metagenome]